MGGLVFRFVFMFLTFSTDLALGGSISGSEEISEYWARNLGGNSGPSWVVVVSMGSWLGTC